MYSLLKKITNLEIFIFGIFILIPLFVVFSRFLLNAIVIGFFLFLIFTSFKNKNWNFLRTEISPYLFAFLFYLFFASVFIHELNAESLLKLIWLFLIVFFFTRFGKLCLYNK